MCFFDETFSFRLKMYQETRRRLPTLNPERLMLKPMIPTACVLIGIGEMHQNLQFTFVFQYKKWLRLTESPIGIELFGSHQVCFIEKTQM